MRREKAIALVVIVIMILATRPVFSVSTNDILVTYRFDESEIIAWLDTRQSMKDNMVENIAYAVRVHGLSTDF